MIKIFGDIYSYYGDIVAASSELSSQGFAARNLILQDPLPWYSVIDSSHYISGSLSFKGDNQNSVCPLDSIAILGHNIPLDAVVTLGIYNSLDGPAILEYTLPITASNYFDLDLDISSGNYWKLSIILTSPQIIYITHLLIGHSWRSTRGVDATSYEITRNSSSKRHNLRNGSTFVQPTVSYKTQKITINELNSSDAFNLSDMFFTYGKSAPVLIQILENTNLTEVSSFYGKIVEWSPLSPSSVSGNYKVSLTIEEKK